MQYIILLNIREWHTGKLNYVIEQALAAWATERGILTQAYSVRLTVQNEY